MLSERIRRSLRTVSTQRVKTADGGQQQMHTVNPRWW